MSDYEGRFGHEGILLHPDTLDGYTASALQLQAENAGIAPLEHEASVTVFIRAHNAQERLPGLFDDLQRQDRDGLGKVQVLLADIGSTDRTRAIAEASGADVFDIPLDEYGHASAL